MKKYTVELNERELEIVRDVLSERLEDLEEDIAHFEENPKDLEEDNEADEEPLTIADYEHHRDEVQTLLDGLPDSEA